MSLSLKYKPWLSPVTITPSGRVALKEDEIELMMVQKSSIYEGDIKAINEGTTIITSQRLVFIHPSDPKYSFAIELSKCRLIGSDKPWFRTPKVLFYLRDISQDDKIGKSPEITTTSVCDSLANIPSPTYLSVNCPKGAKYDEYSNLLSHAQNAFAAAHKAWIESTKPKSEFPDVVPDTSVRGIGIAGILARKQQQQNQTDSTLKEAFTDLNALMSQAQGVTQLLDKLTSKAAGQQDKQSKQDDNADSSSPSSPSSPTSPSDVSDESIQSLMLTLGFISPVTKQSAGAQYHEQLARQLMDFLQKPLELFHGTIMLTDVYCLYNKARGTELISPLDLLKACQLWETLGLPIKLKKYEHSGVYVVQAASFSEETIMQDIVACLKQDNKQKPSGNHEGCNSTALDSYWRFGWNHREYKTRGMTTMEISHALKISLQLIKEYIFTLESEKQLVCKDIHNQTVYYYYNHFMH